MRVTSFVNPGLIDPLCISTVGVSVKEGANPIGFFGTGLKYAIAIILRSGGHLTIWRGREPLRLTVRPTEVRGRSFDVVWMNEAPLGFTTDLGKQWKMWQAFRELYCNTIDEGGISYDHERAPEEGSTTIHVASDEFAEHHDKVGLYVLDTQPLYENELASFHKGPTNSTFYRRVKVSEDMGHQGLPFQFAVNVKRQMVLTEDRTIRSKMEYDILLASALLKCDSPEFLHRWLSAPRAFSEHHADLDWSSVTPGPVFLDVVERLARDPSRDCNLSAVKVMSKVKAPPRPRPVTLLPHERKSLERALEFLRALGYDVTYPVSVVESLGDSILGIADRERSEILLARRALDLGHSTLISTILEEWAHIKFNLDDESRPMQNWLLEQITRLGEAYLHSIRGR